MKHKAIVNQLKNEPFEKTKEIKSIISTLIIHELSAESLYGKFKVEKKKSMFSQFEDLTHVFVAKNIIIDETIFQEKVIKENDLMNGYKQVEA